MRAPTLLVLFSAAVPWLAPAVEAVVFQDQVGQIDFHHELIGLPQEHATFFSRPRLDDKASLLYTLSDMGVIGAVNPSNGALLWRQLLGEAGPDGDHTPESVAAEPRSVDGLSVKGRLWPMDGEGWLAAALGRSVHAWNAVSGRSLWWKDFAGQVVDLAGTIMVADAAAEDATTQGTSAGATKDARRDVLLLSHESGPPAGKAAGTTVLRRLCGKDGHVLWEFREAGGHSHGSQPLRVAATSGKAYIVNLAPGTGLRVVVLDVHTGQRLEDVSVKAAGADGLSSAQDILFVGGAAPIAAWTDGTRSKIRFNILGTRQKHEFVLPEGTEEVVVHAPTLSIASAAPPPLHLLVHTRLRAGGGGHQAQVFHVDAKAKAVIKAYDLPVTSGPGAFAASTNSAHDTIYFTHITDSEIILTDSTSPDVLDRWPTPRPSSHNNDNKHTRRSLGRAVGAAAAEVVVKPGSRGYAVRVAAVTDEDDWALVRNGQLAWTRPEGLSGAEAAVFAEHPESEQLVKALEQEAHSNPLSAYIHRLKRHLEDLERLPAYLQAVPSRLLSSILGSDPLSAEKDAESEAETKQDGFGFHKVAILATRRGRLYGLDAASPGSIHWTRRAVTLPAGVSWDVQSMHVDEAHGVVSVYARSFDECVSVHVETGEPVSDDEAIGVASSLLLLAKNKGDGGDIIDSTALVSSATGPWVLTIGHRKQHGTVIAGEGEPVVVEGGAEIPLDRCPHETVVVKTQQQQQVFLQGIRFVPSDGRCVQETTWTFTPPAGLRIVDVATRPAHDPVASVGRVLGDRRVLYKYLNTNLAVISAVADVQGPAGVLMTFLVDTISGQVLSSATYHGVDGRKPVACLLFENTFVCTYFADHRLGTDSTGHKQSVKGYHLTVSDLYESEQPNRRMPLGWQHNANNGRTAANESSASSSSLQPLDVADAAVGNGEAVAPQNPQQPRPSRSTRPSTPFQQQQSLQAPAVITKTWVIASPLAAMAVTQTRQGITVREVLAYLPRVHGILALPRVGAVLDARRPDNRDPTAAEAEEGLARYTPHIEVDTKHVVSHSRDVAGVVGIITGATNVESTSLVLAYGLDVFGTRVAPSFTFDLLDQGFGKISMMGTVAALAVGVAVLRPMVTKKQINLKWKATL